MISQLLNWLDIATSNFTAAKLIAKELDEAGFSRLNPGKDWHLTPGMKCYMVKNDSAVFAFVVGNAPKGEHSYRLIAAHSDSPCFKIKPNPEIISGDGLVSLNVEKYGGGIMYTWFDRPLSISGRVVVATDDVLHPKTLIVDLRRPIAFIPHLAIHFNRNVNDGNPLSVQRDMKPVVGRYTPEQIAEHKRDGGLIRHLVAKHLNIDAASILSTELCLYPCEAPQLVGASDQFLQSGRIDDLSMAFAGLRALLDTADVPCPATRILAVFDNEETGSGTKQGAHSPVLKSMMERISAALNPGDDQAFLKDLSRSFLISADDAHAWHPNYNDKFDLTNHPQIGMGPVVKINANCKYMTDAYSEGVFRALCTRAGVNCQTFVNHGDIAGGSTLGNILTGQLDIAGVDMGAPIWAMHSARETCATSDHIDTIKVFTEFFK